MAEFFTFNINDVYAEIKKSAKNEPITNKEAWNSFVDQYVNEKVDIGELDPDQDIESIVENLQRRWPDYKESLAE